MDIVDDDGWEERNDDGSEREEYREETPPTDYEEHGFSKTTECEFVVAPLPREHFALRGKERWEQWARVDAELMDARGTRRCLQALSGTLLWSWKEGDDYETWYDWEGNKVQYERSAARFLGVSRDGRESGGVLFAESYSGRRKFCGTHRSWLGGVQRLHRDEVTRGK
jgi:hypothetical protein